MVTTNQPNQVILVQSGWFTSSSIWSSKTQSKTWKTEWSFLEWQAYINSMTKLPFAGNSSEGLWSLLSPRPPKMVSDWNLSFSSIFHVVAVVLVFVVVVLFTDWLTLQWPVCWNPAQSIELSRHYRLFWCVPGRYEADNIWHRINNSEKKINQYHLLLLFFVVPPLIIIPLCCSKNSSIQ